jgi:secondary thiamine-phosphate synthase enzyme
MVRETLKTQASGLHDITESVLNAIEASNVSEGLCVVFTTDIEAGILMTAKGDARIYEDILQDYSRVFPARNNFLYRGDPNCGAAHSKSAIAGASLDIIIHEGKAVLGEFQQIVLADYVGNKECTWLIQCV